MALMTNARGTFLGVAGVPRLGLGLAALGRPGYITLGHAGDLRERNPDALRGQCHEVLDEAHRLGIRYYDAARSYGKAEEFLSSWVTERGYARAPAGGPSSIVVGSKWGYTYTADWQVDTGGAPHEVKEHTVPNLVKQTKETQALLGSHLHLYQSELGWRVGLSVSGPQQGDVILRALTVKEPDGSLLFDSVQATWNVMEQSAGAALLEAHAAGLDVIVKEAMANGRILAGSRGQPHGSCGVGVKILQQINNVPMNTI
ncbi:hypothetical protein FOA52_014918 [Chlamydomonas sp. UWO 241]|nr:hypothetical protein FOA52_014918 [Chlamydomonas sp. UWO 241]